MVVVSPRHLVVGTRSMTEYFYQLSIGYGSVVPSVFGKHALAMVVQGLASEWTEHAVELGDRKQTQNIYKHERWFAKKASRQLPPSVFKSSCPLLLSTPLWSKGTQGECTAVYLRLQNLAFPGFLMTEGSFFNPSDVATQHVPPRPSAS